MNKILNDVLFDILTVRLFENEYFLNQDELDTALSHKQGDNIEEIIGELEDLASVVADVKADQDVEKINGEQEQPEETQEPEVEGEDYGQEVSDLNQEEYSEPEEDVGYGLDIPQDDAAEIPQEFVEDEPMEETPGQELTDLNQQAPQEQLPLQPEQAPPAEAPQPAPQQMVSQAPVAQPTAPAPQPVIGNPQFITMDELKAAAQNLGITNQQPVAPAPVPQAPTAPPVAPPQMPPNAIAGPAAAPMYSQPEMAPQAPQTPPMDPIQAQSQEQVPQEQMGMEQTPDMSGGEMGMDPSMGADPSMQGMDAGMGMDPMMGGDPSMQGMGGMDPMMGGGMGVGMGMDPMMGMEPVLPSPEEIGKAYLLKKIHGKLLDIDKLLVNYTQREYIKFKEDFKEGIELFDIIMDNFEQFKDKIDIVIAQYERFLLVAAKQLHSINSKINDQEKLEQERTKETVGVDNLY